MRWVIGDIHGMLRPLEALLAAVTSHDPGARFLFAGDYINRGPQSRRVIDLLLTLPNARFARGNHDDVFDLIVNGAAYCNYDLVSPLNAFVRFLGNGLKQTFLSYDLSRPDLEGVIRRPTPEGLRGLVEAVPETHRRFFRSLAPLIEDNDAFVIHAAWDPNEPDHASQSNGSATIGTLSRKLDGNADLRQEVLWGRFNEAAIRGPKRWLRTGYFGHTPVQTMWLARGIGNVPVRGPHIVLLDTGAAFGPEGRLTAVCVEQEAFLQADPTGRIVGAH